MSPSEIFETHVLTAAPSENLVTADAVGRHDADPAVVAAAIERVSRFVEEYTSRRFALARYQFKANLSTAFREGFLVNGRADSLQLPQFPLVSVSAVREENRFGVDALLAATVDYGIDLAKGIITRLGADKSPVDFWPPRALTVIAWAGYLLPDHDGETHPDATPLPVDLAAAVAQTVGLWVDRFPQGYTPVKDQPEPTPDVTSAAIAIFDKYRV